MKQTEAKEYLTLDEAAAVLGWTPDELLQFTLETNKPARAWVSDNELQYIADDLVNFLA